MELSIPIYFLLFLIYSIMGWMLEITCVSIEKRKFINRGFLIGPYCPIYGCGAIAITVLLHNYTNNWIVLFLLSVITCGILEYVTSYIMEKLFHARWWDYSNNRYNINGRVCLETLIPFGILGLIVMYVTNPFILSNLSKIPENVLNMISIILAIIFITDVTISMKVISNVRTTSTKLKEKIINGTRITMDNTEEITAKVKEILLGKSILNRRLIYAYPDLKAIIKEKKEEIKRKTEEIKEDIKNKVIDKIKEK